MTARKRDQKLPAAEPANKRKETAENGRAANGQFTTGAPAGPGRPRLDEAHDDHGWTAGELVFRAIELKNLNAAWRTLIADHGSEIAEELVNEAIAAGQHVPHFVRELIEAARTAAAAKPPAA